MSEYIKVYDEGGGNRKLSLIESVKNPILLEPVNSNDIIISGTEFSPWYMPGGNGDASISVATLPRYAAKVKTNNAAALGYALVRRQIEPISFSSSDIIQFEIYCYNPSNSRRVRFTFATTSSFTNKLMFDGFTGSMGPGHNLISMKLASGTYSGATSADIWKYLEISFTNPDYQTTLDFEVGPVYVGKVTEVPTVNITFDSAHKQLYTWAFNSMRKMNIPGNIYVAGNLSTNVSSNYCSISELQEIRSAGWGMGIYGFIGSKAANSRSATSVAMAQSVGAGGNFIINGNEASGGIAVFDMPRPIVLICGGNESANGFIVEGIDKNGNSIVRQISGNSATSFKPYSADLFLTVTRVTAIKATAGTVSVGTGWGKTELIEDAKKNIAFLKDNKLDGDPLNYAFPLGENNTLSEEWLREVGVICARTTYCGSNMFLNQVRRANRNNRYISSCAVTLGDTGGFATFKTQIDNSIANGMDIYVLSHLDVASAPNRDDLDMGLAYLSMLHRQGSIRFDTFTSYEKILSTG